MRCVGEGTAPDRETGIWKHRYWENCLLYLSFPSLAPSCLHSSHPLEISSVFYPPAHPPRNIHHPWCLPEQQVTSPGSKSALSSFFFFFFPPNPVAFRSAEMKAPIKTSVPVKPRHFHVAAPCLSRQSLFVLGSRLHPRALKWPGGLVSPLSLSPLSRSPRR